MRKLTLEINSKGAAEPITGLEPAILVCPPVGEDYWLYRVQVSDKQAVIGFPKFSVIGVGFQHEDKDWNTNLPSGTPAERIFDHIKANRRGASKALCLEAIRMIQDAALQVDKADTIEAIKAHPKEDHKQILCSFLCRHGHHEIVRACDP